MSEFHSLSQAKKESIFARRSGTNNTLLKYPFSRLILPIPFTGIFESSPMRMDIPLYGWIVEKDSTVEFMCLEAPESMMK